MESTDAALILAALATAHATLAAAVMAALVPALLTASLLIAHAAATGSLKKCRRAPIRALWEEG